MNPNGLRVSEHDKVQTLITKCKARQIDRILLSEVNTKWMISNKVKMLRKMKAIRRNIELIFADSSDYNTTTSDWLPGRIMNELWGNWVIVFDKDTIKIDHLGRWMAF